MALQHFLIVYSLKESHLLELRPFGTDVEAATAAYADAERSFRNRDDHEDYEIVLVGADSEETVRVTHSRYFREDEQLVPFS